MAEVRDQRSENGDRRAEVRGRRAEVNEKWIAIHFSIRFLWSVFHL